MHRAGWSGLVLVVGFALGALLFGGSDRHVDPAGAAPDPAADLPTSRRNAIVVAARARQPGRGLGERAWRHAPCASDPFGGMLRDEFFDRFFPPTEYQRAHSGLGSGVIVDDSGVVLTNEHVIRDAERDHGDAAGRPPFDVNLLGDFPTYDLAVLQDPDGTHLPVAPLGDSDGLMVGRVGDRDRQSVRLPAQRLPAHRHRGRDQRHPARHQVRRDRIAACTRT